MFAVESGEVIVDVLRNVEACIFWGIEDLVADGFFRVGHLHDGFSNCVMKARSEDFVLGGKVVGCNQPYEPQFSEIWLAGMFAVFTDWRAGA